MGGKEEMERVRQERKRMNEGIKGVVGIWALLGSSCIPGIQAASSLQEALYLSLFYIEGYGFHRC